MASAVFEAYADQFSTDCAAAGRAIAQLSARPAEERRALQSQAEAELRKAAENCQQMDLEARSAASRELQSRAKACRAELAALHASLKDAAVSLPRAELLGGSSDGEEAATSDQRARLLSMGGRMHEATGKLQAAHRVVLETEAVGESILGDLAAQREVLMHSTGTLQRANEGLARSRRTLQAMGRRALGNKVIMWLMILLLGGGILLLLYLQLFGPPKAA